MGFWSDANIEPKRKFRWTLSIPAIGTDSLWMMKSVTKPSWNMSEHPHKFINHTFHYPGRVEWQPIEVTIVDSAKPIDMSASFLQILRSSGYNFPDSLDHGSQTVTKKRATEAIGNEVVITQHGANMTEILDRWTLKNPFVTDVKTGELDYEGEDLVEVSCTIIYDWAWMTYAGGLGVPGGDLDGVVPTIPAPVDV